MLSVIALAQRIESGASTPSSLVDQCAEVIAQCEDGIGAFTVQDLDRARDQAAHAQGPLRGLPVGVKDIYDTADLPTGYGSPIYKGHQPASDAAIVSLLKRAGCVVAGKTVTTEFAHATPGKTRNPHHTAHTPGGSSSGSAAAVAAGMLPLAIGSQTAGSVIRPAAFCGVAGFKPSFKLLPTVGMKCFSWSLDTAGLFAASVADAAYAAAAITQRDLRVDQGAASAPSIAVVRTHNWGHASDAMKEAVETAARTAERRGARIRELVLPSIFEEADEAHSIIQFYESAQALAFEYDRHRDRLSPALREALDQAAMVSPDAYDAARRTSHRARQALNELNDFDVLLTPSAPGAAPAGLASTGWPIFNRLWTLLGNPSVNVPGLMDDAQLPLGVQIVGRFGRDRSVLEAGHFLEDALRRR